MALEINDNIVAYANFCVCVLSLISNQTRDIDGMAGYLNFSFEFHCFLLHIAVYGSQLELEFIVLG